MSEKERQADLQSLRERVEKADAGDRELDAAILMALMPGCMIGFRPFRIYVVGDDEPTVFHAEPLVRNKSELPHYTASIDAAVALIERKGWRVYKLDASIEGRFCWTLKSKEPRLQILGDPDNPDRMAPLYNYVSAFGSDICLALIAALLNALENHNG